MRAQRRTWRPATATLAALAMSTVLLLGACDGIFPQRSEGERLYRRLCADCHGLDGEGNTPRYMGNFNADLTDGRWRYGGDRTSLETVIRQGIFAKMPENPDLTWPEIKALLEYLKELEREAAKSPGS